MIGIIDYRAGNAPSVLNAMRRIGAPARLVRSPQEVAASSALILPGVGAARATMDSLRELDLIDALERRALHGGIPFLGICVGLQVLLDHSAEGDTDCLGWIPGRVVRFAGDVRVPQIGWNRADFARADPLLDGLGSSDYFYFVNSYYAIPDDAADVLATTEYGVGFASMVRRGNIAASQFHLEKSGEAGLRVLANFARMAGVGIC